MNQGLLGEYGCNWGPTIRRSLAHRRDLNLRPFDTLVKGREPNTGRKAKQAERPNKQGGYRQRGLWISVIVIGALA